MHCAARRFNCRAGADTDCNSGAYANPVTVAIGHACLGKHIRHCHLLDHIHASHSEAATGGSNPTLPPVPGVTMTLTGTSSGSTLTNRSDNYTFSSLPLGETIR